MFWLAKSEKKETVTFHWHPGSGVFKKKEQISALGSREGRLRISGLKLSREVKKNVYWLVYRDLFRIMVRTESYIINKTYKIMI